MLITIDTSKDSHNDMRLAAALLLHIVGDIETPELGAHDPDTAKGRAAEIAKLPPEARVPPPLGAFVPPPPPAPIPPPPSVVAGNGGDDAEPDYSAPSNVVNFPTPVPPPPPVMTPTPVIVAGAETVSAMPVVMAVSAPEYDSAGFPYDARIHQKAKGKKRDGTWKLIKGIDPAIVAPIVAELATRKLVAPGLPSTVPLPLVNTVPVPPVPPSAPATNVPAPPVAAPVPVPPVAPVGALGAGSFRALVDKITAATKAGTLTPQKVSEVCQQNGAPNLMQLNSMPQLIDAVSAAIDLAVLGIA